MRARAGWLLLAAALAVAPVFVYPLLLAKFVCFALFASAFDLLLGGAGLLSLGQAAFFGTGSYLSAIALARWGVTPELALLFAAAGAGMLGAAIGFLATRREGVAFTMVTLAMAQLVYFGALELPATGGENGVQGVPRGALFGFLPMTDDHAAYAVIAVLGLGGLALLVRVRHSPFGQMLSAIRENERRAISLGYATNRHKRTAFTLAACVSGLAGGAKAWIFGIATLADVHWSLSGAVALMVLVGGIGTAAGPALGAVLVLGLETFLSRFGGWVEVIEGAVFVACVLAFSRGIAGAVQRKGLV